MRSKKFMLDRTFVCVLKYEHIQTDVLFILFDIIRERYIL